MLGHTVTHSTCDPPAFLLRGSVARGSHSQFIENKEEYDVMRTVKMGSFGFLVHGTTGHYFYGMLDGMMPGTKAVTVASKVAIDQVFWNPCFGLMFFGYLNFFEGKSMADLQAKINAWVPDHLTPPSQPLSQLTS